MATYPGMSLRGEIRESVSLDEDDLSDVEDEVFIRDGKNGYKFEDMSAKKPLMAPRRKVSKSDFGNRFRNRPPCNALCKLCCYAFVGLTILIGLIILVVILVSLFPLPLDKLKDWIISKTNEKEPLPKVVPCNDLKVTDVWTVNFPKLISDTSVQTVDVNQDGVDDVIFGYGTSGDNALPADVFCNIFMGMAPPCRGGVIALNGIDGQILWRYWLPHSVYSLICDVDVSGDNITDCLIAGKDGILSVLNAQNGSLIWKFIDKNKNSPLAIDLYSANFIPDQDNDSIPDILASHTSQKDGVKTAHILVISGKTGAEKQRINLPSNTETYYTPQLFLQGENNYSVIFGTGGPTKAGNFNLVPLKDILNGNMTPKVLYSDLYKGILSLAIIVDITGDGQEDIVAAMFNSTIVAIDGKNFTQLWNFTIENSETLSVPTPGYFNSDNVTDFLVKYQTGHDFPVYYFSQTFIIDGRTGRPIYTKPIIDSVGSQMGGLTIGFEGYGYDLFLFWMADCKNHEGDPEMFEFVPGTNIRLQGRSDLCKLRFNSSMVSKFYALNQYDQPPGIEIYNSENRVGLEYNNTNAAIDEVAEYMKNNPQAQFHTLESDNDYMTTSEDYEQSQEPYKNTKFKGSNFRHRDNGQGLIRDFVRDDVKRRKNPNPNQLKYDSDYEQSPDGWQQKTSPYLNEDVSADYNTYLDEPDSPNMYPPNKLLLDTPREIQQTPTSNRDPRSKTEVDHTSKPTLSSTKRPKTLKKNLSETKSGVYEYKNVQKSHSRLLNDLNTLPSDILRETYFKNRESQLKKSRFEQRDLKSHQEHIKENEDIKKVLEAEKKNLLNASESLWDLESEKEVEDRENGYWRGKREVNFSTEGFSKFTSVGALVSSLNSSKNSIDLILITYWIRPQKGSQILLQKDFQCISDKLKQGLDAKENSRTMEKEQLEDLFMKECLQQRGVRLKVAISNNGQISDENLRRFPYFNQIAQLGLGQLTIYRLHLECVCKIAKKNEKCAQILDSRNQHWATYLGKQQNGIFKKGV